MNLSRLFSVVLAGLTLFASTSNADYKVIIKDKNVITSGAEPGANELYYAYEPQLLEWADWLRRPYAEAMKSREFKVWEEEDRKGIPHLGSPPPSSSTPPHIPEAEDVRIFEAQANFVIRKPVGLFQPSKLYNIPRMQQLDPTSRYSDKSENDEFRVERQTDFPHRWKVVINFFKPGTQLYEGTLNSFSFFNKQEIQGDAEIQGITKSLFPKPPPGATQAAPDAVIFQEISKINHFAKFGNITTLMWGRKDNTTFVHVVFVMAVERHVLEMRDAKLFELIGDVALEMVLYGKIPVLNTSTGIGSGLPTYAAENIATLAQGLATLQ